MIERNFGARMREIRQEAGLRLADVAKILDVSTAFISEMENDLRLPVPDSSIDKFATSVDRVDAADELKILAAMRRGSIRLPVAGLDEETVKRVAQFGKLAARGLSVGQWEAILRIARE